MTQDVFLRAWRALPAFRAESSGRTWLLSIARRACVDALRRRSRIRRLTARLEHEVAFAPTEVPDPGGIGSIEALVAGLDPRRREAFVLTQIVGCSYEEAATICGVAVGTIRSRHREPGPTCSAGREPPTPAEPATTQRDPTGRFGNREGPGSDYLLDRPHLDHPCSRAGRSPRRCNRSSRPPTLRPAVGTS